MVGMQEMQYHVREMRHGDEGAVLGVINAAFGEDRSTSWFDWKHRRGPWGPAVGWVAESSHGQIVAARLFVPWQIRRGGEFQLIHRAMDGAVLPSAQRQGLFSRTVLAEMAKMKSGQRESNLVYSTSVPASREAYKKLGWTIKTVTHTATLVAPSALRGYPQLTWGDALDNYDLSQSINADSEIATNWSSASLRWRTEAQSGIAYRSVRLTQSDEPHGAIVRVTSARRISTLVIVHAWGPEREVDILKRNAAFRSRCLLTLEAGVRGPRRSSRTVGSSTVSIWSPTDEYVQSMTGNMHFDFADLEGIM